MHKKWRKVNGRTKDLQPGGPNPSAGLSLGYMPYWDFKGRLRMGKGLGRTRLVLQQDRNELQLANHITEKWGSLCYVSLVTPSILEMSHLIILWSNQAILDQLRFGP